MLNPEGCNFFYFFLDPQALWCLGRIRIQTNDSVDYESSVHRILGDLTSPKRSGGRSSAHIPVNVINRSMAWATEPFLVGKPVWSTPQMAAN